MSLSQLFTDRVTLLKQDGSTTNDIKAAVQSDQIAMEGSSFLIEPGDLLQRQMSNGGSETFSVIDPGFHEAFHGIPAGYTAKVKKLGLPEARSAVQNITYNVSGPNARINQNTTDNSTNTVGIISDVAEKINALRGEIRRLVENDEERKEALDIVEAIEGQFQSENTKPAVIKALVQGLPHAASIASIGSFLISCASDVTPF